MKDHHLYRCLSPQQREWITWAAHCSVAHPAKCSFTPDTDAERRWFAQEHQRITLALARRQHVQTEYNMTTPVAADHRPTGASTSMPVGAQIVRRPRERRERRHTARKTSSGDSPEPGPRCSWRWFQPAPGGWGR